MRELEFRIWDVKERCWIPQAQVAIAALDGHKDILTYESDEDRWCSETIEFVVQQFTGLLDINGVKIFEGDRLSFLADYDRGMKLDSVVSFKSGCFSLDVFPLGSEHFRDKKVIGNIFETEMKC